MIKQQDDSLALLTDLYQLTMAQGYWKHGRHDLNSVFHLFYRANPFSGGYAIAAGLGPALQTLADFRFSEDDLCFLGTLEGNDSQAIFSPGFLDYLRDLRLTCDVEAVPEGTVVFPHEPLVRVHGPILQCQILETFLLNAINFPTLIATKSARICQAAQGDPVLEFGLRRAQGIDGALSASRSAFIGGCHATSNVLAAKRFGIPCKGTHAHSWIMSFDDESVAFESYADAMPNNCIFLVDTYETIRGVQRAIQVANKLRKRGHQMIGVRLDSGDLATLSQQARKLLDESGFPDAVIVASNDLDEYEIKRLKQAGAKIDTWGVGTKLVTAYEQPALGGVYKLSKIQDFDGRWQHRVKLSEQLIKVSNPGVQQVRRFIDDGEAIADMIYDVEMGGSVADPLVLLHPERSSVTDALAKRMATSKTVKQVELLIPVMRKGRVVTEGPSLSAIRAIVKEQLAWFPPSIKELEQPSTYPVGLDSSLHREKSRLVDALRTS